MGAAVPRRVHRYVCHGDDKDGDWDMSMLSTQCDKLRKRAKNLRMYGSNGFGPINAVNTEMIESANEMEQAADTIESLRERLQDERYE